MAGWIDGVINLRLLTGKSIHTYDGWITFSFGLANRSQPSTPPIMLSKFRLNASIQGSTREGNYNVGLEL